MTWFSEANLKQAWRYVKKDIKDNFIFDVIDYQDLQLNLDSVLHSLSAQIEAKLYQPSPILRLDIPKSDHTTRPGTLIAPIDLIVLYALAQQLAPKIDSVLVKNTYSYRLNPKADKSGEALFAAIASEEKQSSTEVELTPLAVPNDGKDAMDLIEDGSDEDEIIFPYDWLSNWKAFHSESLDASRKFEFVAITDITAFFENISLDLLRELLVRNIDQADSELINTLMGLFEFWGWEMGERGRSFGLPQGNDVSSFLSNLYLKELDEKILALNTDGQIDYYRYVDDIRLFTSDKTLARKSLLTAGSVLRKLNLNLQSSKTVVKPATTLFFEEVENWANLLDKDKSKNQQLESASKFWEDVIVAEADLDLDKWRRPFLQMLRIFREDGEDKAVEKVLSVFLNSSSHKLIASTFSYLRHFSNEHSYSDLISERLIDPTLLFDYHKAYMLRLAAYCRDESPSLRQVALRIVSDSNEGWYSRIGAAFCLHSFALLPDEVEGIRHLVKNAPHDLVARSAFILLAQTMAHNDRSLLDELNLFASAGQEYLRKYFFTMIQDTDIVKAQLNVIKSARLVAPTFLLNFHKMDILKASLHGETRDALRVVIGEKLNEIEDEHWLRWAARLSTLLEQT